MLALLNSDKAVVRRVLAGNLEAFRVLVERYGGVIQGVALARLQNAADAEDVTQETFTRFYEQLDRMARHKHIGPWLVHVARNACVDVARQRARETALDEGRVAAGAALPDPARRELHRLLWEQLQGLDVESREVLILYYFMRKRAKEIAALLEISPEAAAKRVQRARDDLGRRLTNLLGDEIDELSPDVRRTSRIMAAVTATPAAWKASAGAAGAAATAAGIATGAGAAKLAAAVALIAGLAVLGYLGYERYTRPFSTQDVTDRSEIVVEKAPAEKEPAAAPADPVPVEQGQAAAVEEIASAEEGPVYPPVYGTVTGTVKLSDGTPAAGAEVWLENRVMVEQYADRVERGYADDYEPVAPARISVQADAAGRYTLEGLPLPTHASALYEIHAAQGDCRADSIVYVQHASRLLKQDFTLTKGTLFGGIVKGEGGQPVSGAYVRIDDYRGTESALKGWWWIPGKRTGEDGRFLIEHVPADICRVTVGAEGYLTYNSDWLKAGSRDHIIQLDAGNEVSGRVVDIATGQGVADVQVIGQANIGSEKQPKYLSLRGETDAQGLFRAAGVEPGTYTLSIHRRKNQPLPLTLVEPLTLTVGSESIAGLEVKAAPGAVLSGQILDEETGLPPSGRTVVTVAKDKIIGPRTAVAGADGSYEVVGLLDGDLMLSVNVGKMLDSRQRYNGKVSLQPGEVKENFDIRLPAEKVLAGTVVDESGGPLGGASVCAISAGNGRPAGLALSDIAGRFRLSVENPDKNPSVYLQAITGDSYSDPSGPHRSTAAKKGIVLRIGQSGRLEGELVDQTGVPVENAIIAAAPEAPDALLLLNNSYVEVNRGKSVNVQVEPGGLFSYPKLRPGQYRLEVYAHSAGPHTPLAVTTATVRAGRTTRARLVVDMSWFGTLEGVALLDGKPLPNQRVFVQPLNESWTQFEFLFGETGPDGRYSIRDVRPGEVKIELSSLYRGTVKGLQKTQNATVKSGEVTQVDFIFSGGQAAAEGFITVDGAPVPARVTFEPLDIPSAGERTADADANGWYHAEDLLEGTHRVSVTGYSYRGCDQPVQADLIAGETARIDFELRTAEIRGVVTGLKEGEKAFVGLFPGDTQLPEWSVEALEALGEQMLNYTEVFADGSFSFTTIVGEYIVGAVAMPMDGGRQTEEMLGGRVAMSPILYVVPGTPAEVALEFE